MHHPRIPARLLSALLPLAFGLAGCAANVTGYPSLAPRPIEQMSLAEPAAPPAKPEVADPDALARYAPTVDRARAADDAFRHVLSQERSTLARGRSAAAGSDLWAAAQVSLSRVESAREPLIKALADLDRTRDADPTQTNSGEALAANQAFEAVQRIDTDERTALANAWPSSSETPK